ncbi:gliding motility-associated C-terminal domain-containing protein [Candidatus Amoebophilus asiaticus]|nr:gliding motility-associated C-terminal domain-containing protein [Candidatus Amoebophilus asiaticus]
MSLKAQCTGSWSSSDTLTYLCAKGELLGTTLGVNICPTTALNTYTFTAPVQNIKLNFSGFGAVGTAGDSRMAVFLNDSIIDLNLACNIIVGCQTPSGTHNINSGCLVDSIQGADGGISGFIYLNAAAFGLDSITSIGVSTSEPGNSQTVFEVGSCNPTLTIDLGNDTALCEGDTLTLDATTSNATYLWQDNSTDSTFIVTQQGTYWVEVTNNCGTTTDTINVNYNPLPTVDLGNDTTLCQGDTLTIDATTSNATYLWQDNSTNPTFNVTQQGTYWVNVTNSCGITTDTMNISYNPLPTVDLGNDTILCQGESLMLDATTSNATYLWQDNSTNPTFNVNQQGTYWAEIMLNGCGTIDTITVLQECEIILLIPNVFTPNQDGINDLFIPVESKGILSMNTKIYNRWGQLMFSSDFLSIGWDGRNLLGVRVPNGTYFWIINYYDIKRNLLDIHGHLTILG